MRTNIEIEKIIRINLSGDNSHTLILDETKIASAYLELEALEKGECEQLFLDELMNYEKEL